MVGGGVTCKMAKLVLKYVFLFPVCVLVVGSFGAAGKVFASILKFPTGKAFALRGCGGTFRRLSCVESFVGSLLVAMIATILILLVSTVTT